MFRSAVSDFVLSFFLAGFLTMTVDETNSYLVTGDADGVIKVWDITEYCLGCSADNNSSPRKYQIHCKARKRRRSTANTEFLRLCISHLKDHTCKLR